MGQITDLSKQSYDIAVKHGWYDTPLTFGEEIALCHSELSEALQDFRKGSIPGVSLDLTEELADTVLRIFTMNTRYDMHLEYVLLRKMEKNRERPYRHGGKVL